MNKRQGDRGAARRESAENEDLDALCLRFEKMLHEMTFHRLERHPMVEMRGKLLLLKTYSKKVRELIAHSQLFILMLII